MFEILETLEGTLSIDKERNSKLQFFWSEVESKLKNELSLSLEELLIKKNRNDHQVMYNI